MKHLCATDLTFSSTTCSNSKLSDPTLLKLINQDVTSSTNWNDSARELSGHNDVQLGYTFLEIILITVENLKINCHLFKCAKICKYDFFCEK